MDQAYSPEFEYQGKIEDVPLPVLLAKILDQKLTGMLHIQTVDAKLWIYFEQGFPAGVHAPQSQVFLGSVLQEMGLIDEAAFNESLINMAKTKRLQGELLLEQGSIDEEQLERALSLQLARKLARLFSTRAGGYSFIEDEELPVPMEPIRVNPYALITNGIKNNYSEDDLKRSLGMLVGKSCKLSERFAQRMDLFEFSPEEIEDVELLTEFRNPGEFVRSAASGTTAAMMILLTLVSCGLLELNEPGLAVSIPARKVQQVQPAAVSSGPGSIREPERTHAKPPEPEKTAAPPPQKPAPQPAKPGEQRGRSKAAASKIGADLLKRINEKFEGLEHADHWTVLEVAEGANTDQIKKSFLVLTKIFHPDRIAGVEDQEIVGRMATITSRLNEAFTTLSDPQRRHEYEQQAAMGGAGDAPRTGDARLQFKKALVFLKKKDYQQAAESIRWAVELEPKNCAFQAYQIWIDFLLDPGDSEEDRARKALSKLVPVYKKDKGSFHTIKFLFMLFKRIADEENYVRFLSMAYKSNPKDVEVAREMRLYNIRQEKEKRGLLGFMRKK